MGPMRHSFKVMHDQAHTVKVRISPAWVRWVGEKIWHKSQRARWERGYALGLGTRDPQPGTRWRWPAWRKSNAGLRGQELRPRKELSKVSPEFQAS